MMTYPLLAPYALAKTFLNTWFDHTFYDTDALSDEERSALPAMSDCPQLITVAPRKSAKSLVVHSSLDDFKRERRRPTAFVLAGAVSSSLGGVSLARNVADALDRDVCFILPSALETAWAEQWASAWLSSEQPGARDSDVLTQILDDDDLKVDFVLGHSRGCLRLAEALTRCQTPQTCQVVTIGGVVDLPVTESQARQYLGAYDWLGAANSRLDLDHQIIPASGHHLNPQLPFALNLPEVLHTCRAD